MIKEIKSKKERNIKNSNSSLIEKDNNNLFSFEITKTTNNVIVLKENAKINLAGTEKNFKNDLKIEEYKFIEFNDNSVSIIYDYKTRKKSVMEKINTNFEIEFKEKVENIKKSKKVTNSIISDNGINIKNIDNVNLTNRGSKEKKSIFNKSGTFSRSNLQNNNINIKNIISSSNLEFSGNKIDKKRTSLQNLEEKIENPSFSSNINSENLNLRETLK